MYLVFSGTLEGMFFAVDAESGKLLWRFQTGGAIWSNPISYQAGGIRRALMFRSS